MNIQRERKIISLLSVYNDYHQIVGNCTQEFSAVSVVTDQVENITEHSVVMAVHVSLREAFVVGRYTRA